VKLAGFVEYDGADFAGWAAQPGLRTVEETLTDALETVLRRPVKLSVAGRTDAGVHASGQVVSFSADTDLRPALISYKATAVLPEDLALRRCVSVPEGFDARKDARSRSYEYRIVNDEIRSPLERRRASYVARKLDFGLLERAASLVRNRTSPTLSGKTEARGCLTVDPFSPGVSRTNRGPKARSIVLKAFSWMALFIRCFSTASVSSLLRFTLPGTCFTKSVSGRSAPLRVPCT